MNSKNGHLQSVKLFIEATLPQETKSIVLWKPQNGMFVLQLMISSLKIDLDWISGIGNTSLLMRDIKWKMPRVSSPVSWDNSIKATIDFCWQVLHSRTILLNFGLFSTSCFLKFLTVLMILKSGSQWLSPRIQVDRKFNLMKKKNFWLLIDCIKFWDLSYCVESRKRYKLNFQTKKST